MSPRLIDAILHPSFLRKAHSVPVSLFYFSHPPQKGTGENLKALQLVTISQNRSTECHTLKADLLFSPKNQRLFVFVYGYVGYLLYIDCLLWSWVSLSFRAVAIFQDLQPESRAHFLQLVL